MCLGAIYWARLRSVWYGNTRADARHIGFDDDHIYREVALPVEARSIPTRQILRGEAIQAFEEWQAKADRVRY